MVQRLRGQLEAQGISLELTRAATCLVVESGYDPMVGARPLGRALQRMVEAPLSEQVLSKEFRKGDTVIVDAEDGYITFRVMEHLELPEVEVRPQGRLGDARGQQIRGSGSPTSMSTIRVPPKAVISTTMPGGSLPIRPIVAASRPSG